MNKTKETFVFGFALFAGFFGAGNLILPPLLGFNSGPDWWLVAIGFIISAAIIPLLALFGHAKLQGTMLDFGNKVSPLFSLIYCLLIYVIIIVLPCPRTAAVTHEIAIEPFFGTSSIVTSSIYFVLVFIFVMNRNKVIEILGKYLTPILVIILLAIILIGITSPIGNINPSTFEAPLVSGLLEGYQTYDAIAGMVMGGILVISIENMGITSPEEKKKMLAKSSVIAITGLLIVYAGLIAVGAIFNSEFPNEISRTDLLVGLSTKTLGDIGTTFLSVLVALACFTTAIAIVIGTADFFKGLFHNSKKAYLIAAFVTCAMGIIVGQMNVKYIIDVALPALMIIYPISIVLILLNAIPNKFASQLVFRSVAIVTILFSIPDFLGFLIAPEYLEGIKNTIPLANQNLGWVLPALFIFGIVNLFEKFTTKTSSQ